MSRDYCPACEGHGTNEHECLRSVIVPLKDLVKVLNTAEASEERSRLLKIIEDTI